MAPATVSSGPSLSLIQVAVVSVAVPYRKPGNVIEHLPVQFEVFYNGSKLSAVPFCNENVRRLTALPEVLRFEVERSGLVCKRLHLATVAQDIMATVALETGTG